MVGSNEDAKPDVRAEAEAQAAADGLKAQIAAVRARVRDAREVLGKPAADSDAEPRSFRR